ncbi:Shedu immune nuclease family protein [Rhodoglobus sp. NPDC076762]
MARFGMEPGERGALSLSQTPSALPSWVFVPTEPPEADTPAAVRAAAGAKMLELDEEHEILRIFPLDTRPWRSEFLDSKYSSILRFEVPVELEEHWDVRELLANLPSGFTKDPEYGLGLARECDPLIRLIQEQTDCSAIRFVDAGEAEVDGATFEISFQQFDALRAGFQRIKNRGDLAIRRVRDHFVRQELLDALGLSPRQLTLGRLQTSQWMTRVAAGQPVLSENEQAQLVESTIAHASQIAADKPMRMAQLRREIEMVNLEKLIEMFEEALDAGQGEAWWQDFFERNIFALQLLFGGPAVLIDAQVPIGEGTNTLKGKKIADYLFKNAMTDNASLVEIKKPGTKLLKKRSYRQGVFGVQSEIGEAVAQVLDQALQLTRHQDSTRGRTSDHSWQSSAPRCFIVAGRLSELDTADKKKSFDLYREHLSSVRIVAYDEILEGLKTLQRFLTTEDSAS